MIVVADSSPLIALSDLGKLDLLEKLYGHIVVPEAVWAETAVVGKEKPCRATLFQAPWISRVAVKDQSLVNYLLQELDLGESEAIALAIELDADFLLIDERLGRKIAMRFGITPTGIIGILLAAKAKGLVDAIRPDLDRLRSDLNFWLSDALYLHALRLAGEEDS